MSEAFKQFVPNMHIVIGLFAIGPLNFIGLGLWLYTINKQSMPKMHIVIGLFAIGK